SAAGSVIGRGWHRPPGVSREVGGRGARWADMIGHPAPPASPGGGSHARESRGAAPHVPGHGPDPAGGGTFGSAIRGRTVAAVRGPDVSRVVVMPKLGLTMQEAELTRWLVDV